MINSLLKLIKPAFLTCSINVVVALVVVFGQIKSEDLVFIISPAPTIPPGKLENLTLKLSVIDTGKVGKNKQLVGHIILPLSELEGVAPDEEPQLYKLDIEKLIKLTHRQSLLAYQIKDSLEKESFDA